MRILKRGHKRNLNSCLVRILDNDQNSQLNQQADQFYLEIIDGPDSGYRSGMPEIIKGDIRLKLK